MTTFLVSGGIGSGKSTVCSFLVERGYEVYDCDSRCKSLYKSVPGLIQMVENNVGIPFCRLSDVFSDPSALKRLEDTVYPYVLSDISAWKNTLNVEVCFIESAVALYKPAFRNVYDKVLMVSAPFSVRAARNPAVAVRSVFQSPDTEFQSDYLIINDSTVDLLRDKVDCFIKFLKNEN